jgi:hypothetical protein
MDSNADIRGASHPLFRGEKSKFRLRTGIAYNPRQISAIIRR